MESPSRTETLSDPTLAAELEAIRSQLRDYEKALVERIADVDDDRRGTANKLQRAWVTHSEEVDARARRQGAILISAMTLFVVLVAIALFLVYRQMDATRQPLAAGLAEVKKELGMISGVATQDELVRRQISQLSAAVGGISSSLERLDAGPGADLKAAVADERAARDEAITRLSGEVEGLQRAQTKLTEEAESLRAAVTASKAETTAAPAAGDEVVARLSGEIERLQRAQTKLTEEAQSLRAALAAAKAETTAALAAVRRESAGALAAATVATEAAVSFGKALDERTTRPTGAEPAATAEPEAAPKPEPVQPEPPDARPPSTSEAPPSETPKGEAAAAEPADARGSAEEGAEASATATAEPRAGEVTVTGNDTYALQLMGFYSFQDLVDYAARVDLPDRVFYREETYRGRPWFVLIHSLHTGVRAATEERSRLPPRLARLDTWIRPLSEGMQLQVLETSGRR